MKNQPNRFDFLTHYRGNALSPIILQLKYKSGEPVNLTDSTIRMELKRPFQSRATFVFSSENDGDGLFNILDALEGKIHFPTIKSWGIPADNYTYDLVICDADGNSRCYLRGNWRVAQNISKIPCSDVSGGYSANYSGAGVVCHSQDVDIDGDTYAVEVIVIEVDYQERGEKGDPFLYEDFTPAQIEELKKPATEAGEDYFGNVKPDALQVISDANSASVSANQASDRANTSADNADIATANAVQATGEAILATEKANNAKGWTPLTEFEEYDGKQIKKLTGYIGGTGDEPTENVGLYYMAGGFTSDKDLAVNFKGEYVFNQNPDSNFTTLKVWEGTRNQYDSQQPLGDDVITFIREL